MDGATLEIKFRDETSTGTPSSTTSPIAGGTQENYVQDTQAAITSAGGIGKYVGIAPGVTQPPIITPAPVPPTEPFPVPPIVTAPATDSLGKTIQQIAQADPKATAAEIAAALGMKEKEVAPYLIPPPGGNTYGVPTSGASPVSSGDELLFPEDLRRVQEDRWIESERQRLAQEAAQEAATQRAAQEEAARQSRIPPPPPLTPPPQIPGLAGAPPIEAIAVDQSQGVINTVNAIAHFAHMGGPLGSAVAGVATSLANVPGVAGGLAAAVPALTEIAPFIAPVAALGAVPVAGLAAAENEFNRARSLSMGLSPEATMAEASAEIRQFTANLRTARRLGDEVAEGIGIRSRISEDLQGIRDIITEPILQEFNRVLRPLEKFTNFVSENLESTTGTNLAQAGVNSGIQAGYKALDSLVPGLGSVLQLLSKASGDKTPEELGQNLFGAAPPRPALPPPFGPASSPNLVPGSDRRSLGIPGLDM